MVCLNEQFYEKLLDTNYPQPIALMECFSWYDTKLNWTVRLLLYLNHVYPNGYIPSRNKMIRLTWTVNKAYDDLLNIHTKWKNFDTLSWLPILKFARSSQAKHRHSETIWVPSSEFVSSSIPSWQILTAHAQPFREARDLAFWLKVPLDSFLVWASSGGSGETARMRRLAWTFAARICDKYQIRLTRSYGTEVSLFQASLEC